MSNYYSNKPNLWSYDGPTSYYPYAIDNAQERIDARLVNDYRDGKVEFLENDIDGSGHPVVIYSFQLDESETRRENFPEELTGEELYQEWLGIFETALDNPKYAIPEEDR